MARHKRNHQTATSLSYMRRIAVDLSVEQSVPYEVHHRHPRSRKAIYPGGHINEKRNLIVLPRTQHAAWHTLVKNEMPWEFVQRLNEEFMPPDYYLSWSPREKLQPNTRRKRRYCTDCQCVVLQPQIPIKK